MHRVAMGGRDPEVRRALESPRALACAPAKAARELALRDVLQGLRRRGRRFADRIRDARRRDACATRRGSARRGGRAERAAVHAGGVGPAGHGDVRPRTAATTSSSRSSGSSSTGPVYDLNVEGTHNFVANGLVTHNSIYGFRGADIRNILNFQDDYPDAEVVRLEQNYRSTQTILERRQRGRSPTTAGGWASRCGPTSARATRSRCASSTTSTPRRGSSSGEIERLVDEGVSRAEIAVFYRTNAQSRVLEDTLVRREIGYQVIGGTKFYERAEIKDAIAYLTRARPTRRTSSPSRAWPTRRGAGSGRRRSRACSRTRRRWASRCGTRPPTRAAVPGLGTAAVRGLRALHGDDGRRCASASSSRCRSATCSTRSCTRPATSTALEAERTIEAQGRIENLEELVEVAREFDAAAEERRRRSTSSCSRSRSSPTPTRAATTRAS